MYLIRHKPTGRFVRMWIGDDNRPEEVELSPDVRDYDGFATRDVAVSTLGFILGLIEWRSAKFPEELEDATEDDFEVVEAEKVAGRHEEKS